MVLSGHSLFISEYNMPDDFVCIWSKKIQNQISNKSEKATEKLFVHESVAHIYQ